MNVAVIQLNQNMPEDTFMLQSQNDDSRRYAVFEDDDTSAWLYLTSPDERKYVADVWIHNRVPAPPGSDIKNYYGGPPPAAIGFADDAAICVAPEAHEWSFLWLDNGNMVVLHCDGRPVAMLNASDKRGWSRNLLRDGPWGKLWDEQLHARCTGIA